MFVEKKFVSKIHRDGYLNYLYKGLNTDKKSPLLIYIHGAGSRGNDIDVLKNNTGLTTIEKFSGERFIVAAPHCHLNTWFDLYDILIEFIDELRNGESVDINRVYIVGSSMGGFTAWQVMMSKPEWFAAAVPICGGGMYWNAARLKDMPIWAFHGALDMTVLPEETLHMVKAVNKAGGNAKITIFPQTTHNAWEAALSTPELYDWLLSHKKTP